MIEILRAIYRRIHLLNEKTGWEFKKSKDGHFNGDHWHASPKNAKIGDY